MCMKVAVFRFRGSIRRFRDKNDNLEKHLDFLNETPMLLSQVIFLPRLGRGALPKTKHIKLEKYE